MTTEADHIHRALLALNAAPDVDPARDAGGGGGDPCGEPGRVDGADRERRAAEPAGCAVQAGGGVVLMLHCAIAEWQL